MRIIAYTYEADVHCIGCTKERSDTPGGFDVIGSIERDECGVYRNACDSEGNAIRPIFSTDEQLEPLYCGDCRGAI